MSMDDKALREAIRREWAYTVPKKDLIDRIEQLEAKLAKAVEELENMQKVPRSDTSYGILMVRIKYTLAELKGQSDE